jgi:hypothetical protein
MRGEGLALARARLRGAHPRRSTLFNLGLGLRYRLLDLFQGELQLIGVEPL